MTAGKYQQIMNCFHLQDKMKHYFCDGETFAYRTSNLRQYRNNDSYLPVLTIHLTSLGKPLLWISLNPVVPVTAWNWRLIDVFYVVHATIPDLSLIIILILWPFKLFFDFFVHIHIILIYLYPRKKLGILHYTHFRYKFQNGGHFKFLNFCQKCQNIKLLLSP